MYPNLRAEMARKNKTLNDLKHLVGKGNRAATLSQKINGQFPFKLDECEAIKRELGTDLPLEVLFDKGE